jgi:intraflagellar transport protein 46
MWSRGYNAADYAHLNVPDDVRELFQYIGRYKPHNIALDTKLKCFIPDYIPSVGEIDAFIKVGERWLASCGLLRCDGVCM